MQPFRSRVLTLISTIVLLMLGALPHAALADFVEDFNGPSLGAPWQTRDGYAIAHPSDASNHASFSMTGSQLSVAIPGGQEHNMWWLKHASVLRPFAGTGIYETKVDSDFTGDQQVGLIFQKDPQTFMIFMLYSYTGDTVRAYVERFSYHNGTQYKYTFSGGSIGVPMPSAGPYYIRVAVNDDANPADRTWTFSWSPNGSNWTPLVTGNLEGYSPTENAGAIQSVGVFTGNQPSNFSAFNAKFDYFRYYASESSLPTPPPNDVIGRGADGKADVWWQAVSGATSYAVYTATNQSGPFTLLGTTAQTSYTHTGLTNNVARYYAVAAIKSGVEGPKSTAVKIIPHTLGAMSVLPTNGLQLALNAAELGYALSHGNEVQHWPSALGPKIAASGLPQRRPVYLESALNGQPAVRFDGSDDYLSLPDGFSTFSQGMSLYIVMRASVPQQGFKLLVLGNGADQENIGLGRAGSSNGFEYFTDSDSDVSWFNTSDGLVAGAPMSLSVLQEAGTPNGLSFAELSKNGTPLFGQNMYVPPTATRSVNYIGKSYWAEGMFQGDIAEMLLWNRKLSAQEHATVLGYIEDKYGLGPNGSEPPPEPLQAPAQLQATAGDASVSLQWSGVDDATGYRVHRAVGSSSTFVQIADLSATSYLDTGLVNGTTYRYKVTAYNSGEESGFSPTVQAEPVLPPPPIPGLPASGLVLALSAETAAQTYSNGQGVTVWHDASGLNNHASAGSGAPTLVTNALNGKPVLRFDGSDDYLTLPAGFQNFTAGMSLYIVAKPTALQSGFKFMILGNGPSQQNIGLGRAGSTSGLQYWTDNSSGSTDWFDTSYGLVANETAVFSVTQAGGSANSLSYAEVAKNGVAIHGEAVYVPPVASRGQNYIGKSYWNEGIFQGDIAEIILYNRELTPTEQASVRSYIEDKYAIPLP